MNLFQGLLIIFLITAMLLMGVASGFEDERTKWCEFLYEKHVDSKKCMDKPDYLREK